MLGLYAERLVAVALIPPFALALALTAACFDHRGDPETPEPNVLLIVVDCLRADQLGGEPPAGSITPHLDRLASEGMSFTNAFAPATWTKPSIASLMTGLYPAQHGVRRVAFEGEEGTSSDALSADALTVAEHFQQAGYATGAVINQVHLQARFGFSQGFEHFRAERGEMAPRLNRELLAWLQDDSGGRPFFAYLHYLDLHWPYTSTLTGSGPAPWELGPEPPRRGDRVKDWIRRYPPERRLEVADALAGRYRREVRYIDTMIGELMARLAALGLLDETLIVVTSDHGEGFYEHGRLQHGYQPFEELIRIPLVMRFTGSANAGVEVVEPVSLVDLFPTLADLAGLPRPESVAGRSLAPLWRGGDWTPRLIFSEGWSTMAVRSPSVKLIADADSVTFYDLAGDPRELEPMDRRQCGPACEDLDSALVAYRGRRAVTSPDALELTAQEIEDLRALGYL